VLQGTSNSADSEELRTRTLQAGHDVAVQYRELLQTVLHILSRPGGAADAKQNLPPISRRIAQCVTELVTSAELLKGAVCCPCNTGILFKLVLPCYKASFYILLYVQLLDTVAVLWSTCLIRCQSIHQYA
jgi:hypothetical protein